MKTHHLFWLILIAAAAATGCRSGRANREFPPPNAAAPVFSAVEQTNAIRPEWLQPPKDFFKLGPGDMVDLEILGEPASQASLLVGPDGKVYYSLLNGTFVWGLTLTEAKTHLENELARFLRVKPEITLTLRTVASRRFWMLGRLARPGVYSLATPVTVLEAISGAGGLAGAGAATGGLSEERVDLENSFVLREGRMLPVDLHRLIRQGDMSQNIYLLPDDFVYVRSGVSADLYVLGAVLAPNIVPYHRSMSLLGAIAQAGGPAPYAYLSHVAIVRGSLSRPSIAVVNFKSIMKGTAPDVPLEAGDIIHVPFSPYMKIQVFAEQILDNFVRTIAINEGGAAVGVRTRPALIIP